jgi:hypothetical protein
MMICFKKNGRKRHARFSRLVDGVRNDSGVRIDFVVTGNSGSLWFGLWNCEVISVGLKRKESND